MGGKSTTTQATQQQSQSQPWAPAQPALKGILSGIESQLGNYTPNGYENSAFNTLTQNAQTMPNFGGQAADLAGSYFGGDPTGMLSPALQEYRQQLSPYANGQNLDPTQAPGIQSLLQTIRGDVSNQINGQFAGAGRDLSGLNQQSLARGIAQGEAAPLLAQYNQNVQNQLGAANSLYNASGQTATALGNNQMQGVNFANAAPGLLNQGAMQLLAAQSAQRGLPLNNLGMLENLTVPIAGLGGTQTGTSNSQGSYQMSPVQQALGWSNVFGNVLNQWGPAGAFGGK